MTEIINIKLVPRQARDGERSRTILKTGILKQLGFDVISDFGFRASDLLAL